MNYFTNNRAIETGQEFLIQDDWVEIEIPVREDGTYYKNHKNISKLAKDSNNNYYEYYNLTPDEDGIYQPDYNGLKPSLIQEFEDYYNSDSFRTESLNGVEAINTSEFRSLIQNEIMGFDNAITIWEAGESASQDEAVTRLQGGLPLAECIFDYYDSNTGLDIPIDLDSLKSFNSILMSKIRSLFRRHVELIKELNDSNDETFINSWLENSKTELDTLKASL
jgi:hypothetical protein